MMKNHFVNHLILKRTILYFIFIICPIITFNCGGNGKPEIMVNVDACKHCNMVISEINQACGYFVQNEFIPFDSPGCLLREFVTLKKHGKKLPNRIFFTDYTTSKFITSDSTYFLLTENIPTVMNAGVLCFANQNAAQKYKTHPDEIVTNWEGYFLSKSIPDKIIQISISEKEMNPSVVVIEKNDIVEWVFQANDLQNKYVFHLKGYEELGNIILEPKKTEVKLRMLADKPGTGFPFVINDTDTPIGMVKVVGAHTSDEEAR